MSLFRLGDSEFTLHSGGKSRLLIDCSALTGEDWAAIAFALAARLPPFRGVIGIPRGGLALEKALQAHARDDDRLPLVVCDDVLTTGASMARYRDVAAAPNVGAVFIARGPCPAGVVPLFQMLPPAPWYRRVWEALRDWFAAGAEEAPGG